MASPCEIKHSKTTSQLDYLTLHQELFIQGTGEYHMVPMVHPTFTLSHPIEGSVEQLAFACIANIFCNDFVPSVENHWFQWDMVNLPMSMNKRLALDASITADSVKGDIPFLFPAPLTLTPSTSVCQQALSLGDSDSDFLYLADTSYALHSDDPGLLTMNTSSEQEGSEDSLMLHLHLIDIMLQHGQCFTLEPKPSSCLKPTESIHSMDCPPFFMPSQTSSRLLVGSEGINKKVPTTVATSMRPKGHLGDSFMPAVLHMLTFTEFTAGEWAVNKDQNSNDSFMPASASHPCCIDGSSTVSYPSVSAKAMEKPFPIDDTNANPKGHTDALSIPSGLPHSPVFKLATGHTTSQLQSIASGLPPLASSCRED
ncbi:hypothetical protein EDC04DRAFT_2614046 [Pisolithus marmoratus]|nr:hypothetical protein EDC04DRAFT_2614046 [Pisolithus marmoratus]